MKPPCSNFVSDKLMQLVDRKNVHSTIQDFDSFVFVGTFIHHMNLKGDMDILRLY